MDPVFAFLDLVLHIDKYLPDIIDTYGFLTYFILFGIIFCETGLVVLPYLPGDSLLFVTGALAGGRYLDPVVLILSLFCAAVLGDTVNYWIGHTAGMKVLEKKYCLINAGHLDTTRDYFARYGGATIVIARFVPFIRTFAPSLAGIGRMSYRWFLAYNVMGGALWILTFVLTGYFFGGIPLVKENFSLVIMAIIILSLFAVGSILLGMIRTMRACPVDRNKP